MVGGGKSVWFQFRAHYKVSLLLDSKGKTHRLVMTLPFLATAVMLERREREMHRTALFVLENDTHNIVAKTFINHENLCKLIQTL